MKTAHHNQVVLHPQGLLQANAEKCMGVSKVPISTRWSFTLSVQLTVTLTYCSTGVI